MSEKKIGFFGGTFDPIHLGHISFAVEMQEKYSLEKVFFCPVYISPHKMNAPSLVSPRDRYNMVSLGVEGIPNMYVLSTEIERPPPSYTFDTIQVLMKQEPGNYYLMLGQDCLPSLMEWHEAENLFQVVQPLIARRANQQLSFPSRASYSLLEVLKRGVTDMPIIEISSTLVRQRLGLGLYCGHLVPAKVLDYISQNQLYCRLVR